jgi:MFS family permease
LCDRFHVVRLAVYTPKAIKRATTDSRGSIRLLESLSSGGHEDLGQDPPGRSAREFDAEHGSENRSHVVLRHPPEVWFGFDTAPHEDPRYVRIAAEWTAVRWLLLRQLWFNSAVGSESPFVALSHRNFRLLWVGQLISFSGTTMQTAAILWHVSLLVPAHKGLALGMVGLVRVIPIVIFSIFSGIVADAFDRRRLMLLTQTTMALFAGILALLTFNGIAAVWPVYLLTGLGAAAGSFDSPARQSLIPVLVPRHHMSNAISLNTSMFQIASVVGPSLSGVVIATLGVGWAYALNSLSFLVVILAIVLMRDVPAHGERGKLVIGRRAAGEGLRFVFSSPMIRSTMLLDFFATFFSSAMTLLPIFAQDILRVGPKGYGWLYAAPSVGAVAASLCMIPMVDRIHRRGAVLLWAVTGYGAATLLFGFSRTFWLTFVCLALTGATDTVSMVLRNIIRQFETPDRLRGRMTGVSMVFFMGGPQLGELEAGLVANWFGAPFSVITGGAACLAATAWIAAKTPALVRYRKEKSAGAEVTTEIIESVTTLPHEP